MRIISGYLRSRKIETKDLFELRPATDRYRETLFNILNNMIDFEGINVCDIYAGTGAVGIECISRGAKSCTFVEKRKKTFKLLSDNITHLNIESKVKLFNTDALIFSNVNTEKFDLIFADPPYPDSSIYNVYENISMKKFINYDGLIVIQRGKHTLENDIIKFKANPERIIGDDVLFIIKRNLL